MSIRAVSMVLGLGTEVGGAKRLVLVALADNMNDEGYAYPKRATIAKKAGIKKLDYVTDCLSWLETHGYIERHVNAWAGTLQDIPADKRPNVYRFTTKITNPSGSPQIGEGCSPNLGGRGSPQIGDQNHHEEPSVESTTPLPLASEGNPDDPQASLFKEGPSTRAEKRRARKRSGKGKPRPGELLSEASLASFDDLWENWPRGDKPNRGDKGKGRDAYALRIGERLATPAEVIEHKRHYEAALELYHDTWDSYPSIMHVSSFLNGRFSDFDHELEADEITWPPPPGRSWDELNGAPRQKSIEEVMEIMARGDS